MTPEQAARNLTESQDGSWPPTTVSDDGVVKRRRRSDWTGEPREDGPASHRYSAGVAEAAAALAAHDGGTAAHSDDVVEVSEAIADRLAITGPDREHLSAAAQLHDLGKVSIPASVLRKPGPLTDEEWDLVRGHTIEGERLLAVVPDLQEVAHIVRHTHERFDGKGYPDGLAGDEIPLAARIVFCADAFHAMRCDRPYRRGRPARDALVEIRANAGTQFDPDVAAALWEVAADLRRRRRNGLLAGASRRRLATLLLTLVVGGSAFAATGEWRNLPFAGSKLEAAPPCASCAPAALGALGTLPGSETASAATATKRAPGRPSSGDRAAAAGGTDRGTAPVSVTPRRTVQPPTGRGKKAAGAPAGRGPAKARTEPPGRSGEAPGRPETPVRLGGGAPGRSEEAPGKPVVPGKFGQKP